MEIKCRETKVVHIIQNRKGSFPSYLEISITWIPAQVMEGKQIQREKLGTEQLTLKKKKKV